jgi:hypothetical protein
MIFTLQLVNVAEGQKVIVSTNNHRKNGDTFYISYFLKIVMSSVDSIHWRNGTNSIKYVG